MSEKDELTKTISECLYDKIGEGQDGTTSSELAEALLASDWLSEHDQEVAAKTLIDAAQDIYIPSDGPSTYVDIDYAELLASLYLKGRAEQIKKGAGE